MWLIWLERGGDRWLWWLEGGRGGGGTVLTGDSNVVSHQAGKIDDRPQAGGAK